MTLLKLFRNLFLGILIALLPKFIAVVKSPYFEIDFDNLVTLHALGGTIIFVGVVIPILHTLNYIGSSYFSPIGSRQTKPKIWQDEFWQSLEHPKIIWGCSPRTKRKHMKTINRNLVIGFNEKGGIDV